MMKKTFSGELVSYTNQTNVAQEIKAGIPATFSLAIGAAMIWLFWGIVVGIVAAVNAGRSTDRLVTILALVGISMPVFWLGIIVRYYLAEGGLVTWFPDGEYVPFTTSPSSGSTT
jgi:ABC-type dipeptide/oligopeptide/nickel transport systems, permease components